MNIQLMADCLAAEVELECLTADYLTLKRDLADMTLLDRMGDLCERIIELGIANKEAWDELTKDYP